MKRKNIAAARSAGVSSAKSKVRKGTVKQVLRYVGKYPFSLSATLLLAIVTVGFTLYVPILIGDAMDCIVEAGKVDFSALKLIFFKIGASVGITAVAQWSMSASPITSCGISARTPLRKFPSCRSSTSIPIPTGRRSAASSRTPISSPTDF